MDKFEAVVVDLVASVSDDERAASCTSKAYGDTIESAEARAIERSAVNCNRRVFVVDASDDYRPVVKGPYILEAETDSHGDIK